MRLAVVASHPIQYQAPLFRELARRLDLDVYFAHRQTAEQQGKAGFDDAFEWDVDLLQGYSHRFLANRARRPGVDRFCGTDLPEISDLLGRQRWDALLVTGWHLQGYWQAIRAAHRLRIPVLVRGDSHLGTGRSTLKRALKEGIHRWLMRQFDGFLFVGRRNREYLEHYGAPKERLWFAPHCVDVEWFRAQARAARDELQHVRTRLGLLRDEKAVLFCGKLVETKRPLDLVHALARLRCSYGPLSLLVAGSGHLEHEVRRLAAELGVRVDLLGFQNQTQLPKWYAVADLLVLPSNGETWGLVVNEAMACGTPAVVSDTVGSAPDLIDAGLTGAVFPMGDVLALADAIGQMIGRKGVTAVKRAIEQKMEIYSVSAAAEGIAAAAYTLGRRKCGP